PNARRLSGAAGRLRGRFRGSGQFRRGHDHVVRPPDRDRRAAWRQRLPDQGAHPRRAQPGDRRRQPGYRRAAAGRNPYRRGRGAGAQRLAGQGRVGPFPRQHARADDRGGRPRLPSPDSERTTAAAGRHHLAQRRAGGGPHPRLGGGIMSIRQRLKQVAADTTADAVYEVLRACIIEGEFAPGQRLLSDAIASDLKVSRTPVREALRKLEAEGLIEASGRAGLTVREISEEDLSEFFFVREALEGMAARLASENASKTDALDLHALL